MKSSAFDKRHTLVVKSVDNENWDNTFFNDIENIDFDFYQLFATCEICYQALFGEFSWMNNLTIKIVSLSNLNFLIFVYTFQRIKISKAKYGKENESRFSLMNVQIKTDFFGCHSLINNANLTLMLIQFDVKQ